ncbi:MAG TPA: NACHT domain-containing protein [Trebonia sp.]|nr:NACHT domain-containing protein [Trebonia sp.]
MRKRAGAWRYRAGLGCGLLGLAAGIAVVLHKLGAGSAGGAAVDAELAMSAAGAWQLAVSLWSWWRSAQAPAATGTGQVAAARDVLAGLVEDQWRTEALLRSLNDPDPIPVRWRVTASGELMDHPANLLAGWGQLAGSADAIGGLVAQFRAMRRRRLVILGGPGTGKTTLAVQLVLGLLASRGEPGNQDEPVPVLLSVADWDTARHPRLQDWVAARLAQDYPSLRSPGLGAQMPAVLARRGQVLPVLDGLDELPAAAQVAVIAALNRSLGSEDQVIVTCRTGEYARAVEAAEDVLTSAAVIEPEPVSPGEAADYLQRCLHRASPAWQEVLSRLGGVAGPVGSGGAVGGVVETPLGLWLLRTTYIRARVDPGPLLDEARFPDAEALRADLLDRLIPALIATRTVSDDPADQFRPRRRYDPADVRRWLGFLADLMNRGGAGDAGQGTRDFQWWRLAAETRLVTRRTRYWLGLALGFLSCMAVMITGFQAEAVIPLLLAVVTWTQRPPGQRRWVAIARVPALARRLAAGLVFGYAVGIGIELNGNMSIVMGCIFTIGYCAPIAGLLAAEVIFAARSWEHQAPGHADLRIAARGRQLARTIMGGGLPGLGIGLGFGLLFAPVLAFGAWSGSRVGTVLAIPTTGYQVQTSSVETNTIAFMVVGLGGGLMSGFTSWVEVPAQVSRAITPLSSWQEDRALNLVRIASATIIFMVLAVFSGPFTAVFHVGGVDLAIAIVLLLIVGSALGVITALVTGGHHAWLAYLIATRRLASRGHLPRNLMLFLDDAHRLGLLRAVGPVYQFRHAELQDHLAPGPARGKALLPEVDLSASCHRRTGA